MMWSYILHRLALMLLTMIGLVMIVFVAVRMLPGDIADYLVAVSGRYTPEQMEAIRAYFHLDEPLPAQFAYYVRDLVRGDLGYSYYSRKPVVEVIRQSIGPTVELSLLTVVLVVLISSVLGITAAAFYRQPPDLIARIFAVVCLSVPTFVWGILILLLPALWLGWGPPLKYQALTDDPLANLQKVLSAALALALPAGGSTARMLRSSLLQVKQEEYTRTAYAKGLPPWTVYRRHLLRPALIPVLTLVATFMGTILGGTAITESIFGVPGMGQSTLTAIVRRDLPQIQANVLLFGTTFMLINLIVDVLYVAIDPRIKYR